MRFWLLFLLLNFLLFVPAWLFHFEATAWFPVGGIFYRTNLDAFRFSADFIVLTGALFLFPAQKNYRCIAGVGLTAGYLILFGYNIFHAFYRSFYAETPKFYSELVMAKEALPIMWLNIGREARLTNHLLVIGAVLLALGGVVFLLQKMKAAMRPVSTLSADRSGRLGLAGLLVVAIFSLCFIEKKDTRQERLEFQWIVKQIAESCQFNEPGKYKRLPVPVPHQAFLEKKLGTKPDIYFIAIEAYGAVATLAPELAGGFRQLAGRLDRQLDSAGWCVASTYSRSTIIGGRSWLGFTSALTGMRLDNQTHYNNLFKCNPDFPHLVRMLNSNGYFTARLSTLRNSPLADSILPTEALNRFWGFDRFVQFTDIPYRGFQYDLYGGIPDQYSLGFVRDSVLAQVPQPRFLFFITMSSHFPWHEPPPVAQYWRQLDVAQAAGNPQKRGKTIERYAASVRYELEVFTQFILETEGEAVFILFGDHQPATLQDEIEGIFDPYAVPLHVICRDEKLGRAFVSEGFSEGLLPDTSKIRVKNHEEIYPLLAAKLLELGRRRSQ